MVLQNMTFSSAWCNTCYEMKITNALGHAETVRKDSFNFPREVC
jgi:hypothetical protein